MHNQPISPLEEKQARITQLEQENELLDGALVTLLKLIGTDTSTNRPIFIGRLASIETALDLAKQALDVNGKRRWNEAKARREAEEQ